MERKPWAREADDFARAFAGAYIFGIPMLFTMEMWWIGEYTSHGKLLVFLPIAFIANLGLSYIAGFRHEAFERRSTLADAAHQATDAVAVGIVAAIVMLLVLNRIDLTGPLDRILGMIVIQTVPLSIGASVANEVFDRRGERHRQGQSPSSGLEPVQGVLSDIGATIVGGIFVGFPISPTDEVPMISAKVDYPHLLALMGFSLLVSYTIVFLSEFDVPQPKGPFQHPLTETILTYLVSLVVAFVVLYLFGQIEIGDPLLLTIQQTVVLGLPITVGGAAGRLVV